MWRQRWQSLVLWFWSRTEDWCLYGKFIHRNHSVWKKCLLCISRWTFPKRIYLEKIILLIHKRRFGSFTIKMKITVLLHLTLLLVRTSSLEDSPVDKLTDVSGVSSQHLNSVQHGECRYTFILPEPEESRTGSWPEKHDGNSVQKESPQGKQSHLTQRIQHLELAMENCTFWLQKVSQHVI